MGRVYSSTSDPHDFCRRHMPSEATAFKTLGNVGDGPDDRGNCFAYDAEHPDYEGEDYKCVKCGKMLGSADN